MMQSGSTIRFGWLATCAAVSALALSACSKKAEEADQDTASAPAANTAPAEPAGTTPAAGAPAAAAAPAADNTDTLTGVKFASYTGDAVKGEVVFLQCKTCHEVTPGVNKIGPSLAKVVGRKASTIPNFQYSAANHASGITWTPEKLFQYLESPQRVVPGTKMTFAGLPDPQKRADVIAYLASK